MLTIQRETLILKDLVGMLSDGLQASATGSGLAEHRSSRVYLRQSLRSLLALFKDFPGLLGPKAIVISSHPGLVSLFCV